MFFATKFKPKMLEQWRTAPPKTAKLLKLRQNMAADELLLTADFAWEQAWPLSWAEQLQDEAACKLLVDCWAEGRADMQKQVLDSAIAKLKDKATRDCALNLLLTLDDERLPKELLPIALSHTEAANGTYSVDLLAKLLGPQKEQTGRLLLIVFPDLSEPGKLLAIELVRKLTPQNAAEFLHHALNDPWEEVRMCAAKAAGILNPDMLVEFLAMSLNDRADTVRTAVCETLGLYAGAKAIPTLRAVKDTDKSWTVKSMCSQFITRWENALEEQIRLDEGALFLQDINDSEEKNNATA